MGSITNPSFSKQSSMVVVCSRVIVDVLRRALDRIIYSRSLSWSPVKSSNKLHNPSSVSITNPWKTGSTIGKRSSSCVSLSIVKHSSQRSKKNIKEIRNELLRLLKDKIYLIILPTTIITATKFEDRQITIKGKQFSINDALTRNNIIFNSTGLPSISIPSGLTKNNLPTGVQIIGAPFEESKILTLAYNYECKNNILDKMIPPLLLK